MGSPRIDSRCGVRFSPPIQISPGAHPASCKMGNGSSLMDNAQNNLFLRSQATIQNLYTWIKKKTQLTTCNRNYLGRPSSCPLTAVAQHVRQLVHITCSVCSVQHDISQLQAIQIIWDIQQLYTLPLPAGRHGCHTIGTHHIYPEYRTTPSKLQLSGKFLSSICLTFCVIKRLHPYFPADKSGKNFCFTNSITCEVFYELIYPWFSYLAADSHTF